MDSILNYNLYVYCCGGGGRPINQNLKLILNLLGTLLIVLGIILFVPLLVNFLYRDGLIYSFLAPIGLSFGLGLLFRHFNVEGKRLNLTVGMLVCALAWVLISLVGALPFYLTLDYSYLDTFFETVSGFTTTGITVFTGLSEMPRSIQFWRSLIQWLGGLGFLTFFLMISFRGQSAMFQLFTAESHKIDQSRPVPNIYTTIKILWGIYAGFTALQVILLSAVGVSFFDSLTHALTTLSTGGFSNYDASIAHFQEAGYSNYKLIEYIIIFFMGLGGINFLVHYKVLSGEIEELWENIEMKYFWGILSLAVGVILADHYVNFSFVLGEVEETVRHTLFQVVSILTTTGYGTRSISDPFFPALARQVFLLLMVVGGCAGSTAGGIKIIRVAILKKLLGREVKRIYYPKRSVLPVVLDGNIIPDRESMRVVAIVVGWFLLLIVGGGITAIFSDLPAWNAFSGMFSAVGNIGPFYFSVEKMQELSGIIKGTYILGMLAGRLEILPIFLLFSKKAWRE